MYYLQIHRDDSICINCTLNEIVKKCPYDIRDNLYTAIIGKFPNK